jgi:hypothetical protein
VRLHQLRLEAVALRPAQVHAQQHLGPVLGLGAAGAGLNVQEGVGAIHVAREHAAELELADAPLEAIQVGGHGIQGVGIALLGGHLQQIGSVAQPGVQLLDGDHDLLQRHALATERLGTLGVGPDVRVFELPQDLGQPLLLAGVVKDTPSGTPRAPGDRRSAHGSG